MGEAKWAVEGVITDEAIAKQQSRLGSKFKTVAGLNEYAAKDAVISFANAIGDPNPLWCDEEYARRSPYGKLVAPPSFLYTVSLGVVMQGLRGVHGFHSGSTWEFHRPIIVGDRITAECTFIDLEEKHSDFSPRWLLEYYKTEYFNQKGQPVATLVTHNIRAERRKIKEKGKYSELKLPHPWTEEELTKIEDEVLAEEIQGANVRYWEDIGVGDEIPQLVKGPLTITDIVAWFAAVSPRYGGSVALRHYRRHPGLAMVHPDTHAREMIQIVHFDREAAKTVGLPYPYDLGAERQSWLIQSVTHWAGDHGWMKRNSAEYRKFVYLSDVLWIRGKVTNKYVDSDGDYCVDIEFTAINQRGEDTMPGHSTVALPSREKDVWPLDSRLA